MSRILAWSTCILIAAPAVATPQEAVELEDGVAVVIERVGSATLLKGEGPLIPESVDGEKGLPYAWYFVQDSSLGLVFRKPSGFKTRYSDRRAIWDGDVDLAALRHILAYEIRAILYDVWGGRMRTVAVTYMRPRAPGDSFDHDPGTYLGDDDLWSSVIFVSRVRFDDGTIVEADLEPIARAARFIIPDITVQDLVPDAPKQEVGTALERT
jgi:hypothetical protein